MKTLAAFLCLVPFALIQATSEPVTVQQLAVKALIKCVQEKKADPTKIKEIFKNDILPEDDPEFIEFFACYWKETKVIKEDGSFDNLYVKISYPYLIRERYPSLSEADAQKLASDAVENCQDKSQAEPVGLKGIQYRNCLTQYVKSKQQ